ncbi:MAG: F0F1 ATP synthase subunit B [Clostridia bacterium]|nr:ATP synthase F0 subunit B [Bacillota bacterium]MBO2521887.1 ATP synthase F0 subunit B [Bacillota bacterium]
MLVNVVFAAAEAGAANPVTFDLWTLIFQSLNVLVVMGVLYFMLFKPVAGIMQKREEYVENQLAHAAKSREEADRLLAEYQEQLKQANAQAQQIIEKAERDAEEYSRSRREEAEREAEELLRRAKAEIAAEREKALSAIREEVAVLAVMAATKVIGREINPKDHEALIRDFVSKAGERN